MCCVTNKEEEPMSANLSDLHRAKRGVAILATCIVETLNETDPTFQERFLRRLERAYREVKGLPL